MTPTTRTIPNPPKAEQDALIELHSHAYEHVRAMVKIRSNYFNFYIVVIGIAFAGFFQVYEKGAPLDRAILLPLSALVYVISMFTMMRAERLTGHIAHDIHAIRRAQNILAKRFPHSVGQVSPYDPNVSKGVQFDRPIYSRDRSVESPAAILGGAVSAILFTFSTNLQCWAAAVVATFLALAPYVLWRGEITHLMERHKNCCRQTDAAFPQQLEADA